MAWTEKRKKREFSVHLYKLIKVRLATDGNFFLDGLADKLGVPRQTVTDFQVGRSLPTQEQLKALSVAFGLSLEEFLPDKLRSEMLSTENLD